MVPLLLTTSPLVSAMNLENLFLLALTSALGIVVWFIKRLDARITENNEKKVDREEFKELKRDMQRGFDNLNRELHGASKDSGDQRLQLAVLIEKMTRVEMMLQSDDFQRCRHCTNFKEANDGRA